MPIILNKAPKGDPNFDNVSLLMHMDGAQGSQSFIDSSSNNYIVTANGNAQIDTTIKQLGTGSAAFDGNGDYITIPDDAMLNFSSSDDFTIEGWIYFNSLSDGVALVSKGTSGTSGWTLYYYSGTLYFGVPYISNDISATFNPSLNTWYYLACSRQSGTVRLFIDGIKVAELSNSLTYSSISPVSIGLSHSNNYLNGYVDEIRITKGVARYTSNFTPPTEPFGNTNKITKFKFLKGGNKKINFTKIPIAQVIFDPFTTGVSGPTSFSYIGGLGNTNALNQAIYQPSQNRIVYYFHPGCGDCVMIYYDLLSNKFTFKDSSTVYTKEPSSALTANNWSRVPDNVIVNLNSSGPTVNILPPA